MAAIGGDCLGAGFANAIQNADLRNCDTTARLGLPEIGVAGAVFSGVVW